MYSEMLFIGNRTFEEPIVAFLNNRKYFLMT